MGPAENAPLLPSSPLAAAASRKQVRARCLCRLVCSARSPLTLTRTAHRASQQQQDEGAATAVHRQAGARAELEPVDRTVGLLDDKFRSIDARMHSCA
eukprot:1145296-Rhodomonas_salina.1